MSASTDNDEADEAMNDEPGEWLRGVQRQTHRWRLETIGDDITPLSQAAHTAVEASELLDLLVKDETYAEGWVDTDMDHVPGGKSEVKEEMGDVVVALAGVASLLGLDLAECVEEAREKNGARDWAEHKQALGAGDTCPSCLAAELVYYNGPAEGVLRCPDCGFVTGGAE